MPYANGPFGDYYLSTVTPLWRAGSRTAADAGLTQYTAFANQRKDASNLPVNIGLHYVAATNSLPLDSDGDGVPDYVEVQYATDPNIPMTDGTTNDAYNVAYDDVDLSGNGLVGRIKKALGLNPTNSINPLTLKQVGIDATNGIVTFELPVSYATMTNIGSVNLNLNGIDVTLEDFLQATNGNTLLNWNTLYDPPGQHYLQAEINITGTGDDFAITSGKGVLAHTIPTM